MERRGGLGLRNAGGRAGMASAGRRVRSSGRDRKPDGSRSRRVVGQRTATMKTARRETAAGERAAAAYSVAPSSAAAEHPQQHPAARWFALASARAPPPTNEGTHGSSYLLSWVVSGRKSARCQVRIPPSHAKKSGLVVLGLLMTARWCGFADRCDMLRTGRSNDRLTERLFASSSVRGGRRQRCGRAHVATG